MTYVDGLFPFCVPRYPVWDGQTWFQVGSGDNYTRTASASEDALEPVVGPGTSWVPIPLEVASELFWRAGALRCTDVSASASLSLEMVGQANIAASLTATAPRTATKVTDAAELLTRAERSLTCGRSSADIWTHVRWVDIAGYLSFSSEDDAWVGTDGSTTPGSASITGDVTGIQYVEAAGAQLIVASLTRHSPWFNAHQLQGRLAWGEDGGLHIKGEGVVCSAYVEGFDYSGDPWDGAFTSLAIGGGVVSSTREVVQIPDIVWRRRGTTGNAGLNLQLSVLGHDLELPLLMSRGAWGVSSDVNRDDPLPNVSFSLSCSVEFGCTDWFSYGGIYDPTTGERV